MKKTTWLTVFLFAGLLTAMPADAQSARNRNRLARDEIEASHASTVYDLVQSRRPAWLNRQHAADYTLGLTALLVFMDGAKLDNVDEMRQIAAANVEFVEFLTPGQSEFRFGQAAPNGTISITSRGSTPNRAAETPPSR